MFPIARPVCVKGIYVGSLARQFLYVMVEMLSRSMFEKLMLKRLKIST